MIIGMLIKVSPTGQHMEEQMVAMVQLPTIQD